MDLKAHVWMSHVLPGKEVTEVFPPEAQSFCGTDRITDVPSTQQCGGARRSWKRLNSGKSLGFLQEDFLEEEVRNLLLM